MRHDFALSGRSRRGDDHGATDSRRHMSELVDVIWSGPFHADGAPIGSTIQVTRGQAEANPGWFQTVQAKPFVKPPETPTVEASE